MKWLQSKLKEEADDRDEDDGQFLKIVKYLQFTGVSNKQSIRCVTYHLLVCLIITQSIIHKDMSFIIYRYV